ncbi:ArsR/SmtB family transcription factor [Thermodesulfobacteriota bacterium]
MDNLEKLSEIFKALSDPTRLRIIKMLSDCSSMLCVNAITNQLDVTQSAVSQHLRVLRQAGFVHSERRGYFIHYAINQDAFNDLNELQKKVLGLELEDKSV